MGKIRSIFISIFTIFLVSCGGGGSDSGGGSGGAIYAGSAMVTLTVPGAGSTTGRVGLTITVVNGMVTVSDGTDSGTAPLSSDGKNFSVPINITVSDSGVTCAGDIIHNGTIDGVNITGTISGGMQCSGLGASVFVPASGTFTATQTSASRALNGDSLSDTMRSAIRGM